MPILYERVCGKYSNDFDRDQPVPSDTVWSGSLINYHIHSHADYADGC